MMSSFRVLSLLAGLCFSAATWAQAAAPAQEILARDMREEIVRTDVTVKDLYGREETRAMPITIFRPAGEGPFPLAVFNHGRAVSNKRAAQGRSRQEYVARYLVEKGFVVLVPTRIGYWETYGDFDPETSGECNALRPEPMSVAASAQVLATVTYAKKLPYVDASRWIVAGQSVGGLAAIATVGRNPPGLLGGINFSGGTGGNPETSPGRPCSPAQLTNYWGGLAKTATVPMLWLYWKNDKYWGEDNPKRWYAAWQDAGGRAELASLAANGEDGHNGINSDMEHWVPVVDKFLAKLGFAQSATAVQSVPSGFAEIGDGAKVPVSAQSKTAGYQKFLDAKSPRAFAIGERGSWGWAAGDYAVGKALGNCLRSGQPCKLYAVDDDVVWKPN